MNPERVYYFGCLGGSGHYTWESEQRRSQEREIDHFLCRYDGCLPPLVGSEQEEGSAYVVYFKDFTVLAFWDRSVDGRKNSNSMFLVPGRPDYAELFRACQAAFPGVWKRFPFEVRVKHSADVGWRRECPRCKREEDTTCNTCGCGSCLRCRYRFVCNPAPPSAHGIGTFLVE